MKGREQDGHSVSGCVEGGREGGGKSKREAVEEERRKRRVKESTAGLPCK